jgi:tetratricopeptide (TPR) repeat protein
LSAGDSNAATLDHCIEAETAYQAGNHDLEIEHYTRCIDGSGLNTKTRAIAHNNRGVAHYAKGHRDKAIADYDMALSIDPDYAMAFANRGNAYLTGGNFDQAMRDFDTAIALDPEFGLAYSNRCWLFGLLGRAEEALAACDESLRLSPDNATALDDRAFAYWMLEDQVKVREDLELAHRLDPSYATWQERFREFEALFSIGYPDNEPSFQSADSRAPAAEDALPDGHAGAEDAPMSEIHAAPAPFDGPLANPHSP